MSGFEVFIPAIIAAVGAVAGGVQARRAGQAEAAQAEVAAGQSLAASQRGAQEQQRRAKLAQSRAMAVAAASGAGATDSTVQDIVSSIAGEGDYRSRLALYEGEDRARAYRERGKAAVYEGKSRQNASYISAAGSLASAYGKNMGTGGGTTLLDKYSGGSGVAGNYEAGSYGFSRNPYDVYGQGP